MAPPLDVRLFPSAVLAWIVTWLITGLNENPMIEPRWWWTLPIIAVAILVALIAYRNRREHGHVPTTESTQLRQRQRQRRRPMWSGSVVMMAGIALLAGLSAVTAVSVVERSALVDAARTGRSVTLTMTVLNDPAATKNPDRFTGAARYATNMRLSSICSRGVCLSDATTIVAMSDAGWADYDVGTVVESRGKLRRTEPGSRQAALFFPQGKPSVRGQPGPSDRLISTLRQGLVDASSVLEGDPQALVPAIAVGDVSALDQDLQEAVKVTGLSHMVAVSGSHCVVVVAVVAFLVGPLRRYAVFLAVAGVFAVLALNELVRHEPSVVRATAMSIVASLGMIAGRRSRALPALGATVIILLLADPWLARSYGFALSCAATAGLAMFSEPWTRALQRFLPRWLAALIAVPAAAQTVCAPIIVLLDPAITPYAVVANVAAGPALAPATLCGLAATVGYQLNEGFGQLCAWLAGIPANWIAIVAHTVAGFPGTKISWPEGPTGAVALAIISIIIGLTCTRRVRTFLKGIWHRVAGSRSTQATAGWAVLPQGRWLKLKRAKGEKGQRTWWARYRIEAIAVAAALAMASVFVLGGSTQRWAGDDWLLVQCDVGQGDALAIRSGPESVVLIDVGPPSSTVGDCLTRLGITTVDLLVLSHDHLDHIGGLEETLGQVRILRAMVPAQSSTSAVLSSAGIAVTEGQALDQGQAGEVQWTVFGPERTRNAQSDPPLSSANEASGSVNASESQLNDESLVLLFEIEGVRIITLGDTEDRGQSRVLRQLQEGTGAGVDVVKVAHHGSAKQNHSLARELSPAVALFSAGADNTYGHPSPQALELYAQVGALTLRTDSCGDIVITGEKNHLGYICRGT